MKVRKGQSQPVLTWFWVDHFNTAGSVKIREPVFQVFQGESKSRPRGVWFDFYFCVVWGRVALIYFIHKNQLDHFDTPWGSLDYTPRMLLPCFRVAKKPGSRKTMLVTLLPGGHFNVSQRKS